MLCLACWQVAVMAVELKQFVASLFVPIVIEVVFIGNFELQSNMRTSTAIILRQF